jgi:serine/threonine protein kinase
MNINGQNGYDCLVEELKVLKRLEHPNIIFLQEIIDDNKKDNIFLVTEYHSKGSITDQVEKKERKGLKE